MMTFLNPLDALIPKIPFSFFAEFWVWVTSEAQGSVSVGFWGAPSIEPFLVVGGGSSQGPLLTPRSPYLKARPPRLRSYRDGLGGDPGLSHSTCSARDEQDRDVVAA